MELWLFKTKICLYFSQYFIYSKESVESNKDNHENDIGTENHQGQETKSLLRTAFVVASLSFHSAITGLTLGLEEEASGVWINLAAIASHKFVIAFSVGVEMVSSKVCNATICIYISLQKIVVVVFLKTWEFFQF